MGNAELTTHGSMTHRNTGCLCMLPKLQTHLLHDRLKHEAEDLIIHAFLQWDIYTVVLAVAHPYIFD